MRKIIERIAAVAAVAGLALGAAMQPAAAAQDAKLEKPSVKMSVGGKPLLVYLPLTLAERLGYFKDEGLDVEISDFQGGAKSLQALIGGSVDVTTGFYDHTIQMQAKRQPLVAVVEIGISPAIVLGIVKAKAASYKGPQDLKGMKIGVTAPGSSTNFMVNYILQQNGMKPEDVSFIGVGGGASAVAAVKRGEIDAISNIDPVISQLESTGDIKIVADTRTPEGTKAVYGGPYPAAVLYMSPEFAKQNPNTTQALVNAYVRTLKWMHQNSAEKIADTMPPEYALGDKQLYIEAIRHSVPTFSRDGRLTKSGGENAYRVLSAFDPAVAATKIDIAATFDDRFVEKALASGK
jgi:NitT/TauT family transport system substrate-binding protein